MNSTAPTLEAGLLAQKSRWAVGMELVKARLTALVLVTTGVGFYLGSPAEIHLLLGFHTLLGTGLLAAGAATLNQWMERDFDRLMQRTQDRPIPSGRIQPERALLIGGFLSAGGLIYLALGVGLLTSLLGALTLVSYLFVYTPLKRVTSLNTVIGAIPGAIPPLMGWTAATGEISAGGWALFAILFFWQLPHFMAIAWLYREDYARAGYAMLSVEDPAGERIGRQAVSHTLGLLSISLFPVALGLAGRLYLAGALVLGIYFLLSSIAFSRTLTALSARRLFLASILYLPVLLILMVADKIK